MSSSALDARAELTGSPSQGWLPTHTGTHITEIQVREAAAGRTTLDEQAGPGYGERGEESTTGEQARWRVTRTCAAYRRVLFFGLGLSSSSSVSAFLTQGAPQRLRYSLGVTPVAALKAREKCWGDEKPSELPIAAAVLRLPAKPDWAR